MVIGLDLFREHFRPYTDRYVLIGGTACMLALEEAGLPFRATKDLDIVKNDLREFTYHMRTEKIDFKSLGLGALDLDSVLVDIGRIYDIG